MIANLKTRRFIKKVKVAVRRIRNIFLILFGLTIAIGIAIITCMHAQCHVSGSCRGVSVTYNLHTVCKIIFAHAMAWSN